MANDDLRDRISKIDLNRILGSVSKVLHESGMPDVDVTSIGFYLKSDMPVCPPGKNRVFKTVKEPDGSVVTRWVCE